MLTGEARSITCFESSALISFALGDFRLLIGLRAADVVSLLHLAHELRLCKLSEFLHELELCNQSLKLILCLFHPQRMSGMKT